MKINYIIIALLLVIIALILFTSSEKTKNYNITVNSFTNQKDSLLNDYERRKDSIRKSIEQKPMDSVNVLLFDYLNKRMLPSNR